MELVLATHNLHKVQEFREMLRGLKSLDLLSLRHFPNYTAPDESGASFQEIASQKALHAAKTLNRLVLADDSGLTVPLLPNEGPGIFSKRYAGLNATDHENRKKLLQEMSHLKEEQRSATLTCCLVLASPEKIIAVVKGTCEGMIALEEKGSQGFGYDPLFIKLDYDKTFAELGDSVKNRVSHRRKAIDRILPYLENL